MNFLSILFLFGSILLSDGGPTYAETNLQLFVVEPFNAISSLAYLVPVFYWLVKLKGQYKEFFFLSLSLPLLFLGGVGSTFYHAFRNSSFFLFLDVFPIVVLTLMVSTYFWIKILPKWWLVFFVLAPFLFSRIIVYYTLAENIPGLKADPQTVINISYFITGTMIFLPALILVLKDKFQNIALITISCILFILGLTFREVDSWNISSLLSMGTHWLWHISTAAGSWLLGIYLYHFRKREIEKRPLPI